MRLELEGVHFISNGSLFAFAEPSECVYLSCESCISSRSQRQGIDLRNLPSLVPQQRLNETAHVVEAELLAREARIKEKVNLGNMEESLNG